MLNTVIDAAVETLRAAGIHAVRAYRRQQLCAAEDTLVCMSVRSAKALPAGFGGYLGLGGDPGAGGAREMYGARCMLGLGMDVYARRGAENGPEECLRGAEEALRALDGLAAGLKISAVELSQPEPEPETGRFVCRGVLTATAYFVAQEEREDGLFTDFILRGSVKK